MASFDLKLPDIGEGVTEGELVRWLVKEGDVVKHDQPLLEVMTDKATVEIPSSSTGKVLKLVAKEGQVVKVGGVLCQMDSDAGADSSKSASPSSNGKTAAPAPMAAAAKSPAPQASMASRSSGGGGLQTVGTITPPPVGENVLASPATRRYAREAGVDLNTIKGSGPAGRITHDDVVRVTQTSGLGAVAGSKPAFAPNIPVFKLSTDPGVQEERKPLRGIRKKIAENLQRSKQIIPHFTHSDEVDVTEMVAWRTKMKPEAEARGVKLTYLPLIMKAVAVTGREFPQFNASIDDAAGEIVYKHSYNIGFAADTPEGLLVPVVKNVESKTLLQIAHEISVLADKAKAGKLSPDDMRGGTITVTNIGSIGGLSATPIINHPEVAIIGVFKIQKKPVVVNDQIVIRDMMGMTATCDHRLVDGAAAARFLNKLMKRLENPNSLLMELV